MKVHLLFLLLAPTLPYTMLAPATSNTFDAPHNQNVFLKRRQTEGAGYNRYYPQSPLFASFPNTETHQHDHAAASIAPSSVKIRSPRIENPYANSIYPRVPSQDAFTSSKSTFVRITPPPPPFIFSSTAYSTEPPIPSSPKSSPTPPSAVSSELPPLDTTEPEEHGSAIDAGQDNPGMPSLAQVKASVNNNVQVKK